MLFRKKVEPACCLCLRSTPVDEDTVRCSRKGIRPCDGKCVFFQYDPCKRIPAKAKAMDFAKYEEYDYSL